MKSKYTEAKHFGNFMLLELDVNSCQEDSEPRPTPPPFETIEFTIPVHTKNKNKSNNYNNNVNIHFLANSNASKTCTYETLDRPFKYDTFRGRWSSSVDFYFACLAHTIGTMVFCDVPVFGFVHGGVYFFPALLIAMLFYGIPIFGIQTFLGQFSTSGTVSALRVVPIFKGLGYSILLLNLCCLSFAAVIAAIPLIYAVYSLYPTIPWMSCDNTWNSPNCSTHNTYVVDKEELDPHATIEFFHQIVNSNAENDLSISWPLLYGMTGTWLLTFVLLRRRVSFLGKYFRCCCFIMLSIFVAVFAHILLTKELNMQQLLSFLEPSAREYDLKSTGQTVYVAITATTWLLGPGWGNVLNLASHNNFRTKSENSMYWIAFTFLMFTIIIVFFGRITWDNFRTEVGMHNFHYEENHYMQFLCICYAYLLGSLPGNSNLWCFIFFLMLFLAELNAVLVQSMTVLTALFDEYEKLRPYKSSVTLGLVLTMILMSLYFCTKQGFEKLHILPLFGLASHVIISLVLLIMTTWIYGRDRFQCDVQFMLGKTISTFQIFLLRIATPIFLIISIIKTTDILDLALWQHEIRPTILNIVIQFLMIFVAIVYMIYKVSYTTGSFDNRLRQCFKPHDWHPVDAYIRRFYDDIMGISEMLVIDREPTSKE